MDKILTVIGPTSTGKTDLALQLAHKFSGELVSADSRQVYKGLDIGTGKMPEKLNVEKRDRWWSIDGIKVWMLDVVNPKKQYSVANYIKDAEEVIAGIIKRGKLPIVVGGTGLYLKALLEGLPNLEIPIDLKLRERLNNLEVGKLQQKLQELDEDKWQGMNNSDRQNPRRLIRAIELKGLKPKKGFEIYYALKVGLNAPRNVLYQRSDERVLSRMQQGMVEEAERLYKEGLSLKRMRQLGLEYGVLADYLDGKIKTQENLVKILQGRIHGYIRRQLTWFKKEKNVFWFDICDNEYFDKVEKRIARWYYQPYATKN